MNPLYDGVHLSVTAHSLLEGVGSDFDVVAGVGPYADALSHAVAMLASKNWTTPRGADKDHGTLSSLEGHRPTPTDRVLLLHDDDIDATSDPAVAALLKTGAYVIAVRSVETPDRR